MTSERIGPTDRAGRRPSTKSFASVVFADGGDAEDWDEWSQDSSYISLSSSAVPNRTDTWVPFRSSFDSGKNGTLHVFLTKKADDARADGKQQIAFADLSRSGHSYFEDDIKYLNDDADSVFRVAKAKDMDANHKDGTRVTHNEPVSASPTATETTVPLFDTSLGTPSSSVASSHPNEDLAWGDSAVERETDRGPVDTAANDDEKAMWSQLDAVRWNAAPAIKARRLGDDAAGCSTVFDDSTTTVDDCFNEKDQNVQVVAIDDGTVATEITFDDPFSTKWKVDAPSTRNTSRISVASHRRMTSDRQYPMHVSQPSVSDQDLSPTIALIAQMAESERSTRGWQSSTKSWRNRQDGTIVRVLSITPSRHDAHTNVDTVIGTDGAPASHRLEAPAPQDDDKEDLCVSRHRDGSSHTKTRHSGQNQPPAWLLRLAWQRKLRERGRVVEAGDVILPPAFRSCSGASPMQSDALIS